MPVVLCVDDLDDDLEAMADRLRRRRFEVTTARSPEEALRQFEESPYKFDVVATDLLFENSPLSGETLMDLLLDRRDERGYGMTPEVVCVTGERLDAETANRVKMRGGHYVVKGTEQYVIEVEAAVKRIQRFKESGPTLVFVHTAAETADLKELVRKKWFCLAGESVSAVYLLKHGQQLDNENLSNQRLPLSPIHMRILDFFARRAIRRSIRLEEVAHSYSNDPFYAHWLTARQELTISSDAIRNYVKVIRKAFDEVGLNGHEVLATENLTHDDDEEASGATAYRLHAWPIIQHLR